MSLVLVQKPLFEVSKCGGCATLVPLKCGFCWRGASVFAGSNSVCWLSFRFSILCTSCITEIFFACARVCVRERWKIELTVCVCVSLLIPLLGLGCPSQGLHLCIQGIQHERWALLCTLVASESSMVGSTNFNSVTKLCMAISFEITQ